jgi:hypothetical protein
MNETPNCLKWNQPMEEGVSIGTRLLFPAQHMFVSESHNMIFSNVIVTDYSTIIIIPSSIQIFLAQLASYIARLGQSAGCKGGVGPSFLAKQALFHVGVQRSQPTPASPMIPLRVSRQWRKSLPSREAPGLTAHAQLLSCQLPLPATPYHPSSITQNHPHHRPSRDPA